MADAKAETATAPPSTTDAATTGETAAVNVEHVVPAGTTTAPNAPEQQAEPIIAAQFTEDVGTLRTAAT